MKSKLRDLNLQCKKKVKIVSLYLTVLTYFSQLQLLFYLVINKLPYFLTFALSKIIIIKFPLFFFPCFVFPSVHFFF